MTTNPGVPAEKRLPAILPLVLILMFTAGLYANTINNELTYWDDNRYVTDNPRIRDLSPGGIIKIFDPGDIAKRRVSLAEYLPVTTLVHAIVYNISGLNPAGYHVANLLLYLIDIVLLYYLLNLIVRNTAAVLLSVLTFSVLTVHVESVTWVSGTKDVLSFLFLMLSFFAYIKFVRKEGRALFYYGVSLVFFTLGLLSKTLVVTLPALLILFDICVEKRGLKIADKVPYLALGAFLSIVYMQVNKGLTGFVYLTTAMGHYRVFLTDLIVLKDYIRMFFLPLNLNAFYYYLPEDIPRTFFDPRVIYSAFVVAGSALVGVLSFFKGKRLVSFSIFWFFIAFLPILNIIIPSSTIRADRYMFIPSVGLSILTGWAVWKLTGLNAFSKRAVPVAFAAWVIFLSILTFQRNGVWQDGITLWQDSTEKSPASPKAHSLLGNEYRHRGMTDEAVAQYEEALRLRPGYAPACTNLGILYGMNGRYGPAEALFKECIGANPAEIRLRINLAKIYIILGKREMARAELVEVLKRDPENPTARAMMHGKM